jgi:8-oxo-dGTP diphosphatase
MPDSRNLAAWSITPIAACNTPPPPIANDWPIATSPSAWSRPGNPFDNAKAESFMKTLKTEEINGTAFADLSDARRGAHSLHSRSFTLTFVPLGKTVSRWAETRSVGPLLVPFRTATTLPSGRSGRSPFLCARDGIDDSALRQCGSVVEKSSKLVATKRGRVLLVWRRRDHLWMFPGGRKRGRETEKDCSRREIREELPELKLGRLRLWKEVEARNRRSGRKMSEAIFVANKASGRLAIGDKKEIDKATWRKPWGVRLTPTSRYIRDKLL